MSRRDFVRAWWAGFFVLTVSMIMLVLCTFLEVRNTSLIEMWKYAFSASIGYVVGAFFGHFRNKS